MQVDSAIYVTLLAIIFVTVELNILSILFIVLAKQYKDTYDLFTPPSCMHFYTDFDMQSSL